jgi:hypothetical protein
MAFGWFACCGIAREPIGLGAPSLETQFGPSPAAWRFSLQAGAEGSIADTAEAHSGRHAARLEKTNGLGFMLLATAQPASVQPVTEYEAVVHLRVRAAAFGTRIYFCNQDLDADGKPVGPCRYSPHFLSRAVLTAEGQWQRHACRWTTHERATATRLQFLVAGNPACVVLDDFELRTPPASPQHRGRTDTSEKPFDPALARAALARRKAEPAAVRMIAERPLFAVGDTLATGLVHQGAYGSAAASRYGGFGHTGVHLHTCTVQLGPWSDQPNTAWKYPAPPDFAQLEQDLLRMVGADPQGYAILQVRCDMPQRWCLEHKEHTWTAEDGRHWFVPRGDCHPNGLTAAPESTETLLASYGSPAHREAMGRALTELGRFVATHDVGRLVVGFIIGGGNDGQFFDWSQNHQLDHSPGHRLGFQAWLREIYGQPAALRQAWGDANVDFLTAGVASEAERTAAGPLLSTIGPERRAADSNRYASIAAARLVKHFARTLKHAIARPVFSMCYYPDAIHDGGMNIYALSELLAGPDRMDSATAVQEYAEWRAVGGTGGTNGCWGSHRLRGTAQLCEIDYRTYRSFAGPPWGMGQLGAPLTAAGFRAQIRRDLGAAASRGMAAWYYDMSGGWYDEPELWSVVEESRRVMDWAHRPEAPSPRAEMAVLVDEDAGWRVSREQFALLFAATNRAREALNLSGVPYDPYLLDDVTDARMPDYKVYLLLSSFTLRERQLAALERRCRKPGRVLVVQGLPGLGSPELGTPAAVAERLTGIHCALLPAGTPLASVPMPDVKHPIVDRLRGAFIADGTSSLPVLAPDDPQAVAFGRFVRAAHTSHALKVTDRGTAVVVPVGLNPQLIHNLARIAGIGTRGTAGQVTYVGSGVAVCHRVQPETATVEFDRPVDLLALDGRTVLARNVRRWQPQCKLLETDVVFYRPAE